jgi:hypothetical protein
LESVPRVVPEPLAWRTLADVADDPAQPLIVGMLEPSQTLMVAPPGTGKGMTGAWLISEALGAGLVPLIYDAERRPSEWSRRVGGLGVNKSVVGYLTPDDLPRVLRGRPLWDAAPYLRQVVQLRGIGLLLVDSALPAVGKGEEAMRSDPSVPWLYVAGLAEIGVAAATFAHPPKSQPDGDPFGSFAWKAAHRLVWSGQRAEGSEHRVRWRSRKANERGRLPAVLLAFTYRDDRLIAVTRSDDEEATRDFILSELASGPHTRQELVDVLLEDEEEVSDAQAAAAGSRIARALTRMAGQGWVNAPPRGAHKGSWSLRLVR